MELKLYDTLLGLNYYGWYLQDEMFTDCPFKVYRYPASHHWGNTLRVSGYGSEYEVKTRGEYQYSSYAGDFEKI